METMDQATAFCLSVYDAFIARHLKHGRCGRHNCQLRKCGCDPKMWLDMEHGEKMDLRRAHAYGRLLARRRNKLFWDEFMKMQPGQDATPSSSQAHQ